MVADFHLHTSASDGELDPGALVARAASHGVRALAITDHDTLGAYLWHGGLVFEEARRRGVELTVGIELDVVLDGREVHLLGLGVDKGAAGLSAHLDAVGGARRERARRELALVRERFGEQALAEEDVFVPGRESLMRPTSSAPVARPLRQLPERLRFHERPHGGRRPSRRSPRRRMIRWPAGERVLAHLAITGRTAS
jgi:hypothetical protein